MAIESEPLAVDLDEEGRYHRQSLITWWDQQRLSAAKVLVVGAGALGNELVKNLALTGVGTIVVLDMDRVENSNLSRCVLFREGDEGAEKATVVARRAAELNSEVRLIPVVGDARLVVSPGLASHFDVILGGLDNREARLHVNQVCWKAGRPWVDGAIEGLMGMMRVFVPPDSACYECTMNAEDQRLLAARKACSLLTREQMLAGRVPTTATSAAVIAGLQVQEAIKLLHRDTVDADFAGRGFAFNGLTHDSYVVTYRRREECLSHDSYDLDGAVPQDRERPLGELLERGRERLGAEVVLDLEQELVRTLSCAACEEEEAELNRPLLELSAASAACPRCGAERRLTPQQTIAPGDERLLALSPADLGLRPFDVVTARDPVGHRTHFVLDGDSDPLAWLEAGA
jgi:molybdopterin/thiamine biosynthesis adenylyltransferase